MDNGKPIDLSRPAFRHELPDPDRLQQIKAAAERRKASKSPGKDQPDQSGPGRQPGPIAVMLETLGPDCTWEQAEAESRRRGLSMNRTQFDSTRCRLRAKLAARGSSPAKPGPKPRTSQAAAVPPAPAPAPAPVQTPALLPPRDAGDEVLVSIIALAGFRQAVQAVGGVDAARQVLELLGG